MTLGYNQPLYILPFDHRGSFQTGMFGWNGTLSPEQTAHIAAAKQVIYDGFKAAVAGGVAKSALAFSLMSSSGPPFYRMRRRMATLPQPRRRRVGKTSLTSSMAMPSHGISRRSSRPSARSSCATIRRATRA
jgi:hypothetical protein